MFRAVRPFRVTGAGVAMLTVGLVSLSTSAQATQTSPVGSAIEVPGLAALNTGGVAQVSSLSCATAGNCVAGGNYTDSRRRLQAWVADEVNGIWQNAREVPGLAALNVDGDARVSSVSCGKVGNCVAGGDYADSVPTVLTIAVRP